MSGHGSLKVILGSLAANLGIAAAKGVAAFITGSGTLVAESIHSLADCSNQILLLVGAKEAEKPPTPEHPLGRGRAAYFWSFLVALMIFMGGGVFSIYEGLHKMAEPGEVSSPLIAFGVLGVALLIEGAAAWQCVVALNRTRGSRSFLQNLDDSKDIDVVVLFAENSAAVLGLLVALIALVAVEITGDTTWDAIGTVAIGALLCMVAVWLARKVKSLLQGESADPEIEAAFRAEAAADTRFLGVLRVLTLQQGPGQVMVAAKVRLGASLSTGEAIEAINALEVRVKARQPSVVWQFVEPDNKD